MIFTAEEIVTILTCFAKQRKEIESLRDNPYVGDDFQKLMDRDLVVMQSIENKIHPSYCGA